MQSAPDRTAASGACGRARVRSGQLAPSGGPACPRAPHRRRCSGGRKTTPAYMQLTAFWRRGFRRARSGAEQAGSTAPGKMAEPRRLLLPPSRGPGPDRRSRLRSVRGEASSCSIWSWPTAKFMRWKPRRRLASHTLYSNSRLTDASCAARALIRPSPSDPRHAQRESTRVRPVVRPGRRAEDDDNGRAQCPTPPSGRLFFAAAPRCTVQYVPGGRDAPRCRCMAIPMHQAMVQVQLGHHV